MNNLQFNEWLENRDPELYSEVDWRGLAEKGGKLGMAGARMAKRGWDSMEDKARSTAKKAALGGAIGMAALGAGNHMLGPGDMDLVQKHFPNVAVQELNPDELEAHVAMAKAQTVSQGVDRTIKSTDHLLDKVNKFQYKQHNRQEPDGGFRSDVPDTHYQNPSFRK